MTSSDVVNFYTGKNIFITGGSGFVGICLLEKILRLIPDHGTIYLLLRPKRDKEINDRLDEIKKNRIFEKLLESKSFEEVFGNVKPIAGDVGADGLGLSNEDRLLITSNINVIIHSAATLDFGDTLKTTVNVNLLGTRRVTELAKECANLKVLIHISSAYVTSYKLAAEEILYEKPCDPDELIKKIQTLTDVQIEEETPGILKNHPNTYTITKHLAEHEIKNVEELFPCTIVRPSMIVGAWKEPIPGWTISKNGPQGFLMGAAKGVVRRLPVSTDLIYDYIPVDIVINNILTAGYTAGSNKVKQVQIYHCTSSTRKPFKWGDVQPSINKNLHKYPLKSAVWYPYIKFLPSLTWYRISAFFIHIIPALILDTITRLSGGRPILMKLHRNVNTSLGRLKKFIFTEWKFDAKRTEELQKSLSKTDQQLFGMDISELNWVDFFISLTVGARTYLNNEPMKTLPAAKTKNSILFFLNVGVQVGVLVLVWCIASCVFGLKIYSSAFVVSIAYLLFNLL